MDNRQLHRGGDVLRLGDITCRIEGEEGRGGSTVVYRAVYQDSLSRGQFHHVLVKELFPWTADGSIFRAEDGTIQSTEEGRQVMEACRNSFLDGNKANLMLLARMPQQISGNLNSYEAYGTYYSVLTVHGGTSLQQILDTQPDAMSLRTIAETGICILDALACFHGSGLLHLDISPDNVLMLSSCSMLIDYNSVWHTDRLSEEFLFSMKEGYTSPEIQMRELSKIAPCSDLYSVAAVLFRILTGRRLTNEDVLSRSVGLSRDLPAFRDVPASAAAKMVQIVRKGLHILARKRYQTCEEMRHDLEEVLLRLDRKGITRASLWEGSHSEFQRQCRQAEQMYLPRSIRLESEENTLSEDAVLNDLCKGGHLLLCGMGGMGKTCLLQHLWGKGGSRFSEQAPVIFYVPLSEYREAGQEPYFIRKTLLRRLNLAEKQTLDAALQELNQLLQPEGNTATYRWIFLLDGLNETGSQSEPLLKEIEGLSRIPGIGILVTDRTTAVKRYALWDFRTAELLPLSEETVLDALTVCNLPEPADPAVFRALTNPMMLDLYRQIQEMEEADPSRIDFADGSMPTMQAMIDCYMDALCTQQLHRDSGSERDQLRHTYLLQHLLPEISRRMQEKEQNFLSGAEMASILSADYRTLRSRAFSDAFPDYTGKSRLMLEGIANEREWYDYAVSEQLAGNFGLLQMTRANGYRFSHDNFMECLAENGKRNRAALRRVRAKRATKWAAGGAVVITFLCLVLYFALPHTLSDGERQLVTWSADQLITNSSIVNTQLYGLNDVLDDVDDNAVQRGSEEAIQKLLEKMDSTISETNTYYTRYYAETDTYITQLQEDFASDIPTDTMDALRQVPKQLQTFLEEVLALLTAQLDNPTDESLADLQETAALLSTYTDAYTDVYYLKYISILQAFNELGAEDAAEDLADFMDDLGSAFANCRIYYGIGNISKEQLQEKYSIAQDTLREAAEDLKDAGLPVISD